MLKLIKYLKPFLLPLILLVAMVYIQVAANLTLPDYMAKIINTGIVGKDNHYIWTTGGWMLLIALGGTVAMVLVGFLAARVATGFAKALREKIFTKIESFSLAEFNSFSTASLITRSTNDIQQIQMVTVMILRLALMAPITGIWAIYKAYQVAPSMTWIMALSVGVLLLIISTIFAVALPKFRQLQKLVDKLNLISREILTGLRVIRAFNTEKDEEKKFDIANVELTNANLFVNRIMVIMQPIMMLIMNGAALLIVWTGAHLINSGSLEIGNMIAFMQYSMQVIFSFLMISIIFIMVPRGSVSGQRINEVLTVEPVIKDPKSPVPIKNIKSGLVEFKDVTFSYPGADSPTLENVSFTATPGQTTAFIGSTGSGKSTLINLVPRFYDTTEGSVKIDNVDVKAMLLEDLYSKIGYVPQTAVLFSGTVESNVKYGAPNINEQQVSRAIEIAQAKDFVAGLTDGTNSPIAQGGTNVSGGQKQRLSIARAIARDPEIYIFDDSFSALDFKTDASLREALNKATKNKTVLIVAQRISTIMNADKIIVLDEGRIVGQGRHKDLMKSCEVYREIAASQLSEEELADIAGEPKLKGAVL